MKLACKLIAAAAAFTAPCAIATTAYAATPIVLTFEGVGDGAAIGNFYNGGTDSQGHAGTNYGISFSSSALGLIDTAHGGTGDFSGEPSASTVLYFPSAASAILNYSAGFDTGFSFFYTSSAAAVVNVFSGLNGTGALLGSAPITAQYNTNCSASSKAGYCNWTASGVSFAGVARSISFGGAANNTAFDNVTFGSATATGAVPEPATWAMMILGFGVVGGAMRRRPKLTLRTA